MRRTVALIATVGMLAALTACASPSSSGGASAGGAGCVAPFGSGDVSETITAPGEFGQKPAVSIPTPLHAETTEVSTLIEGSGDPIENGQLLQVDYTLVNGTDGSVLEASAYDGATAAQLVAGGTQIPGLSKGVLCSTVGSRIAIAIAPEDGFESSQGAQLGLAEGTTLVVVVDVERAFLARADGAPQPASNGFPNVTLDESGRPGLEKPSGNAPTELRVADLKKGEGETVQEGDRVVVNYTGWLWADGSVFDSSWENGQPVALLAADGKTTQGGVVPGFADALIGSTVGSQFIAIIPADQAYGDTASSAVPADSTLVFVVDVLGIQ